MAKFDINFLCIVIALGALVFILADLYWGIFVILLAQPFFISMLSEGPGIGLSKVLYGILFALWFGLWSFSKRSGSRPFSLPAAPSVALPALALGCYLGLAILLGLAYGANFGDIVRDLSQYVGYLAVLPLLDLVRTPKQARKLIFFLAPVGLASSLMGDVHASAIRQKLEVNPVLDTFAAAGQYG
ncbi:MAG: hypothetical protein K6T55_12775, partial [Syntrophobacterales bacterium]|nr:hypothetical protein [Syntrophobacterales bacterium]